MTGKELRRDFSEYISEVQIERVLREYPIAQDYFRNLNISHIDTSRTLPDALFSIDDTWLSEFGLTRIEIVNGFAEFLSVMTATTGISIVNSLTIIGGQDKSGSPENIEITISRGDIISIVGPTGSGKSQLLADIECLAQGDTPTKRRILIDGGEVTEEQRFGYEGKLVAQLSQNMNFIMDLSVAEFLDIHAHSRFSAEHGDIVSECIKAANALSGEQFTPETKVTQLSGGQSRALMIADCAYISQSPIVLIDEIENAGIDRRVALEILAKQDKIVLISTHDPLLAIGAEKRIVIKNGGLYKVIETTEEERRAAEALLKYDGILSEARQMLRSGNKISI